jgi:hypothetical protein
MEQKFSIPTEMISLPSEGLLYPKESPLLKGTIEMRYMSAVHEDILTNQSYIQNGTVLDKLLQSLIVTKINYDDLLIGDKNAIMIAARILGYGKDYKFIYRGEEETVDLTKIENSPLHEELQKATSNEFTFTLPGSGNVITFKLLTHGDEKKIEQELKGLSKINKNNSSTITTRLKHQILSVNGETEKPKIREFVDNYLLAQDSRALRERIKELSPDVDLTFFPENGDNRVDIPIGLNFFWPDL